MWVVVVAEQLEASLGSQVEAVDNRTSHGEGLSVPALPIDGGRALGEVEDCPLLDGQASRGLDRPGFTVAAFGCLKPSVCLEPGEQPVRCLCRLKSQARDGNSYPRWHQPDVATAPVHRRRCH